MAAPTESLEPVGVVDEIAIAHRLDVIDFQPPAPPKGATLPAIPFQYLPPDSPPSLPVYRRPGPLIPHLGEFPLMQTLR